MRLPPLPNPLLPWLLPLSLTGGVAEKARLEGICWVEVNDPIEDMLEKDEARCPRTGDDGAELG